MKKKIALNLQSKESSSKRKNLVVVNQRNLVHCQFERNRFYRVFESGGRILFLHDCSNNSKSILRNCSKSLLTKTVSRTCSRYANFSQRALFYLERKGNFFLGFVGKGHFRSHCNCYLFFSSTVGLRGFLATLRRTTKLNRIYA